MHIIARSWFPPSRIETEIIQPLWISIYRRGREGEGGRNSRVNNVTATAPPRRQMTCNPHLLLRYFWPTYSMPPIASHTSSRQLCVCVLCVCVYPRSRSLIPARFSFAVANNALAERFRVRGITSHYGPVVLVLPAIVHNRGHNHRGRWGREGARQPFPR